MRFSHPSIMAFAWDAVVKHRIQRELTKFRACLQAWNLEWWNFNNTRTRKKYNNLEKNTRMLENNDLRLLTLASDHKITSFYFFALPPDNSKIRSCITNLDFQNDFLMFPLTTVVQLKVPDMFQRRLETMRFRECIRNFKRGPPFS